MIERLFAVLDALDAAGIPHAVGGAIALAFCTKNPRGTRDIDLNVFVGVDKADSVLASLPSEVSHGPEDVRTIRDTGQVRLSWGETPVDLFFNNLPLHQEVAAGKVTVPLEGREIPVLDASSLVVFKSMFDRARDWVDIQDILEHDPAAVTDATKRVSELLGADDPISQRLDRMIAATRNR